MAYNDVLQEKIKERPINKKKLLRRTVLTVAMAAVFGLVACITFSFLEPVISKMIYPEAKAETVTFPEEKEEVNPEDMAVDEEQLHIIQAAETAPPLELPEEPIAEAPVENILEEPEETRVEGYQKLYDEIGDLAEEAQKSMVTVTAVSSDVNWINDTLENKGTTSGLIVADNGLELLILANCEKLSDAEEILITFFDEVQIEAKVKEKDKISNLGIITVPLINIPYSTRVAISYATLGSSRGKNIVGRPVIAVGAPNGLSGSVCYGMVTSQGTSLGYTDANYKLLTTDIYGSATASGVLVNMAGEVIGVLFDGYQNPDMVNQLCAIGISELKKVVEKLSNGETLVATGIQGADLSSTIREKYEIPVGAYVRGIEISSPAMKAGVQSGDVIISINGESIVNYTEFMNILYTAKDNQTIPLTLMREGQNGYQEVHAEITVEAQKPRR